MRSAGHLTVSAHDSRHEQGDDAVLWLYSRGGFDAVATDDALFIRHLRGLAVPYAVPAILLVILRRQGTITQAEAARVLTALRLGISGKVGAADTLASLQSLHIRTQGR